MRRVERFFVVLATVWFLIYPASAQITTELVVDGLSGPVGFAQDPIDPAVQYVLELTGRIRIIDDGVLLDTDFLDLTSEVGSGGERGLLGMAFAPDHETSGRFYVNFTDIEGHTVIARFVRSTTNPLVADPASRFDIRWPSGSRYIVQPDTHHNGGDLAFGPDGYLYIGLGDGGEGDGFLAQLPTNLLGKMLRIDVDVPDADPDGYVIPPDNPFLQGSPIPALGEIWSFGLRNPWRYSFDDPKLGGTGALIVADVGQSSWEEINYEPPNQGGRNYGWHNREGAHDYDTSEPPAYLPLTDPISEYDHTTGGSITGGFVYRGGALPTRYVGEYFYSDFIRGRVWSLALAVDAVTGEATELGAEEHTDQLGGSVLLGNISAMGTDSRGELYILNFSAGTLHRIVATLNPGDLFIDFGSPWGVWALIEGKGWQEIHPVSPERMITGDPDGNGRHDLILDFGAPFGIWMWANNSVWVLLNDVSGEAMVAADLDGDGSDEIVADFGASYGIWSRGQDGVWTQLHNVTPVAMASADLDGDGTEEVVTDFGAPYGIYAWWGGSWIQIHQTSPESMTRADLDGDGTDEVVIDFGDPYGIYAWWGGTWVQIHQTSPESMIQADLDGDGTDEVVIDFGDPYGIYARWGGTWVQIHQTSPESMVRADLDGDGSDEVVTDFGDPYGAWSWSDAAGWVQVHQTSPESMTAGRLRTVSDGM